MFLAEDVMTTSLITVFTDSTVEEAARTLLDRGVSGLIVLERPKYLRGIITEFELLGLVCDPQIKNSPVSEFMRKDVIKVETKTPLEKIADIFIRKRINRVPVVRDGVIVGVVSRIDIIRYVLDGDEQHDGKLGGVMSKLMTFCQSLSKSNQ